MSGEDDLPWRPAVIERMAEITLELTLTDDEEERRKLHYELGTLLLHGADAMND